jgi:hypothetical protein
MQVVTKIVKKHRHEGIRVMFCGKDDWSEAVKTQMEILSSIYDIDDFFVILAYRPRKNDPDVKFCTEHGIELINHDKNLVLAHPPTWESGGGLLLHLVKHNSLGIDAFVRQKDADFQITFKARNFKFYWTSWDYQRYWFMHLLSSLRAFVFFELEYPQMEIWHGDAYESDVVNAEAYIKKL